MASPVAAARQPLSHLEVNTTFYPNNPSPTTSLTLSSTKPLQLLSQKRTHSQISGGQENISIQTQILNDAFKTVPPRQTREPPALRQRTTTKAGTPLSHAQAAFKEPLPRPRITMTTRRRQETHDPRTVEKSTEADKEWAMWRRTMKAKFQTYTFYFDGCESQFQEQMSILLPKFGAVIDLLISS
jgi:hypothetical protein